MTPAIRTAKAAAVPFTVHRYEHDPRADSFGLEAAEKLGISPERLFKTLIVRVEKQLVMALVPAAARLDLEKLALAADAETATLADPAAAERATGYVVGGISPIGGRKKLPTFVDASVLGHTAIFVSAGQRGVQMELSPEDLIRLTEATTADLAAG